MTSPILPVVVDREKVAGWEYRSVIAGPWYFVERSRWPFLTSELMGLVFYDPTDPRCNNERLGDAMASLLKKLAEQEAKHKKGRDLKTVPSVKELPLLVEFLAQDVYDGKPRKPGKMTVSCEGDQWMVFLLDPGTGICANVAVSSPQDAAREVEVAMEGDGILWRKLPKWKG